MRVDGVTLSCVAGEYSTGLGTLVLTASHDKSLPIRVVTSKGHIAQLVTRAKQAKGYSLCMINRNQRARSLLLSRPPSTGLDTGLRRSNPVGKAALGFGMNEGYGAFLPRKRPDSGGAWQ